MAAPPLKLPLDRFLLQPLPRLETPAPDKPPLNIKRTSKSYSYRDIRGLNPWPTFITDAIAAVTNFDGADFSQVLVEDPVRSGSPNPVIVEEDSLRAYILDVIVSRIRRALRSTWGSAEIDNLQGDFTAVSLGHGSLSVYLNKHKPDLAYFEVDAETKTGPNRLPGNVKPSWKWDSTMAIDPDDDMQEEYKQAISQVYYYIRQHGARFGYILTDRELVVFRAVRRGHLDVSAAIPWAGMQVPGHGSITIPLALWYLGMLASTNGGAEPWTYP
ncbi:hypothetical protein FQN57_001830 [Myotisia sp. PD_48]|nr:hypothetical protein FQN57_001830 [Myotisia sp. PD_48]